jgi:tetratricopeptide (TPR) repeat protein/SAM-dependent methyltransferase
MIPDAQSLYANAVRLHQAGRRAEAEQLFRQVLAMEPRHAGSLHLLGVMQYMRGDGDAAVALIGEAIAIDATVADYHSNLGLALNALGRRDEAAASLRLALALNPGLAESWNNLGNVYLDQDRLDLAAESYRKAQALAPEIAAIHVNLADALRRGGKLAAAVASYRKALALAEGDAGAHEGLGDVLRQQGSLEEAAGEYRRALAIDPARNGALGSLASLVRARGDVPGALALIRRALAMKEDARTRRIFAELMQDVAPAQCDSETRALMVRAVAEAWDWPAKLAKTAAGLVLAGRTGDTTVPGDDPLLRALLVSAPNCDLALEALLTGMRRRLLDADFEGVDDGIGLRFSAALARQCFINEYVWPVGAKEKACADAIRRKLIAALDAGGAISPLLVAAVASYLPLGELPEPARLLARPWPRDLEAVLTQQLREPVEEQRLRSATARLTAIADPVSRRVRAQYEENPYPRWVKTAACGLAQASVNRDILAAGCGTGQYLIELAQQSPGARILAVDLSLASLAYARRKAEEMGLTGIDFAQGDILALGGLSRRFDLIECSGVLHHLADPWMGCRVLLDRLRPGGRMRLGLYSEVGRRPVTKARQALGPMPKDISSDDIRRRRQDLISLAGGDFSTVMGNVDFYSISGTRDLLFHVQEQAMTLDGIATFLRANRLTFLGFSVTDAVLARYRKSFPDDLEGTNLDCWRGFERDNPTTFLNMYQFWVRSAE